MTQHTTESHQTEQFMAEHIYKRELSGQTVYGETCIKVSSD